LTATIQDVGAVNNPRILGNFLRRIVSQVEIVPQRNLSFGEQHEEISQDLGEKGI
jgi:hypothetical protein